MARLTSLLALIAAIAIVLLPAATPVASAQDGDDSGTPPMAEPRPEENPLALAGDEELKEFSLEDCLAMCVQQSFTLKRAEVQPRIAAANRTLADAQFDWLLTSSTTYARVKDQGLASQAFGNSVIEFNNNTHVESWTNRIGIARTFDTGTETSANWNYQVTSRTVLGNFTQSEKTGFELAVSQNLLKNLGPGPNRYNIELAEINQKISDSTVLQEKQELLASVQEAFWNLVFAHEDLKVTASATALARRDLDIARRKRQAGLATDIDVVAAEDRLKQKERELYERQKLLRDASDSLLTLMAPQRLLDLQTGSNRWIMVPTEYLSSEVEADPAADVQQLVRDALSFREEIRQAGLNIDSSRLTVDYFKNQRLPELKASVGFNFGGQASNTGNAFDSFARTDQIDWSLALEFSMPLGQIESGANVEKARQEQRSAEYDQKLAEVQVIAEVLTAVREVQTATKVLEASEISASLAERQVSAAEERLKRGLATRFEVDQFKNQLDEARRARLQSWVRVRIAWTNLRKATGTLGR